MKELRSEKAPAAIGPYSQGVESGGFFYFSGQIALNYKTGDLVQGGFVAETTQVMENIKALLEETGLGFHQVLKVNISLTDMHNFPAFNEIYASYFQKPYPARACVGVASLPKGAQVEVEIIAHKA
jgi:2-iminobutanoate/2-iminopropanoate deaminase